MSSPFIHLLKVCWIIPRVFYCSERRTYCTPTLLSLWSSSRKFSLPWISQPLSSPSPQPVLNTEILNIYYSTAAGQEKIVHSLFCAIFPLLLINCVLPASVTSNLSSQRCYLWWIPFPSFIHQHACLLLHFTSWPSFYGCIQPSADQNFLRAREIPFVFSAPSTKP